MFGLPIKPKTGNNVVIGPLFDVSTTFDGHTNPRRQIHSLDSIFLQRKNQTVAWDHAPLIAPIALPAHKDNMFSIFYVSSKKAKISPIQDDSKILLAVAIFSCRSH